MRLFAFEPRLKVPVMKRILAAAAVFCLINATADATESEIVKVEETWAFAVGAPETALSSPQVSTMMGPYNTADNLHFVFTLNHRTSPQFLAGGMQVQVWNGEALSSVRTGPVEGLLTQDNETVRWTQRLEVNNGAVTFSVVNGTSASWGNFGGQGYLSVQVGGVDNLNAYRPWLSLTESGVGYGGNRVSNFQLEKIKWTLATGQEYQLVAPIDIDADLDP